MPYLQFISDKALIAAVGKIIHKIEIAEKDAASKLHKNVLDPFSALFDGIAHGISYTAWVESEKVRQAQKTMQNAVGVFHQEVLGNSYDCENLGTGNLVDVCNKRAKIVAEIKNKFNTTKGNHKVEIYNDIKTILRRSEFAYFTGYYVEIIPQNKKIYNKPFTPSDNKTGKKKPEDEKIRIVDGKTFYTMMTGREDAIQELFEVLPRVVTDNFPYSFSEYEAKKYLELFAKAFVVK